MTAPSPSVQPLGPCMRILDEVRETICCEPGIVEILVRNKFALYAVTLCVGCRKEHQLFYQENPNPRPRRIRGRAHTRGSNYSDATASRKD